MSDLEDPWQGAVDDWSRLHDRLERAVAGDEARVRRLSRARTTVAFSRGRDAAVTLLLDRRPPVVTDAADAEVHVRLDRDAAEAFARGDLVLSTTLLAGGAHATGPVRRYLAVDPVLRSLLRDVIAAEEDEQA